MTGYIGLGARKVTAALDATGNNTGNWTNWFKTQLLGIDVPHYQLYRGTVKNAPAGSTASIFVGTREISFTAPGVGGGSEWDPTQPPELDPGQEIFFYWDTPATGPPPIVTLWFRYSPALVAEIQRKALNG